MTSARSRPSLRRWPRAATNACSRARTRSALAKRRVRRSARAHPRAVRGGCARPASGRRGRFRICRTRSSRALRFRHHSTSMSTANPTQAEHLAVVATGGYGRGMLAPHSDIDLLFLRPYKQTPWGESVIEFLVQTLWDLGLKVGHATRSIAECVRLAKSDITIRTALSGGAPHRRRTQAHRRTEEEVLERRRRRVAAAISSRPSSPSATRAITARAKAAI